MLSVGTSSSGGCLSCRIRADLGGLRGFSFLVFRPQIALPALCGFSLMKGLHCLTLLESSFKIWVVHCSGC